MQINIRNLSKLSSLLSDRTLKNQCVRHREMTVVHKI